MCECDWCRKYRQDTECDRAEFVAVMRANAPDQQVLRDQEAMQSYWRERMAGYVPRQW